MSIQTAFLYLRAAVTAALYPCFFILAGAALPRKVHGDSLLNMLLVGFMGYFSLFQLTALPCKLLKVPLHVLCILWTAILLFIAAMDLIFRRKILAASVQNFFRGIRKQKILIGMIAAAVLFACFIVLNENHISDYDAGYYLGLSSSSAYSDTIELMDGVSGQMRSSPEPYYLLNTLTVHSAVFVKIFHLTALVEQKVSFSFVMTVLFVCLLYRIGTLLFMGNRKNAAMFSWISVAVLMFSYSLAGTSHYFAYRTYEGKSICAYFYMPAVFAFFVSVYVNPVRKEKEAGAEMTAAGRPSTVPAAPADWGWTGLFLTGLSEAAFCNTAFFVVPFAMVICLLPLFFYRRSFRQFLYSAAALMPACVWLLIYLKLG